MEFEQEHRGQINPWLLIALIVVIVGAGVYFYFYFKGSVTPTVNTPTPAQSALSSDSQELNNIDLEIEKLNSDLDQINKVDASASEDTAPAL